MSFGSDRIGFDSLYFGSDPIEFCLGFSRIESESFMAY